MQQGKDIGQHDLSLAEPTYTHMALYELHRRNILSYVVSQNCDGLHLRSGLPRNSLSEVHGNMYVEVCKSCKPNAEYWRLFDTTELTARYYHKTNRRCHICGTALVDTIVHFGERGSLKWPLNWDGATHHADKADVILCIGSSLKVLKKYPWLWSMDRAKSKRPKIFIVNLQWTPKDATATMKINGKCDEVMKLVMKHMNVIVPEYNRQSDPIFAHASLLAPEELHTRSQPMLKGHKETKSDDCELADDSNDCKSEISENGYDDIKVQTVEPLPDSTPILRNDTKLLNSAKNCVVPKEIVANERNVHSSCDRLGSIYDEKTCAKITDPETPVENDRASPDHKYSTNGSVAVTNGTSLNENGCTEKAIQDKLSDDLCAKRICDKKPSNDPSPTTPASNVNLVPQTDENDYTRKLPQRFDDDIKDDDRTNCNSIKNPSPTKCTIREVCLLNNEKGESNQCERAAKAIKRFDYCKVICHLPHWYDVNYAYSGLHSIIYPPPAEVDLWGSVSIPIFQLNRSDAECDFCFDNYAEYKCQFYRPKTTDFSVTSCRKGRLILCECCDYTDESDSENTLEYSDAKRAKLDIVEFIKDEKEPAKIQAGWFGKGYRKLFRRKRRA